MRFWSPGGSFLCVCGGALFCAGGIGQTPPATGAAVPTIKTGTQTVLVDVVVGDRSGQSVTGLKQGDFAIFEDGKPQAITYFETHGGAATTVARAPKLPEGMYSNFPAEVKSDVVDVVLLDSLNTPTEDQMMVRKEMIAYLKALIPPGTRHCDLYAVVSSEDGEWVYDGSDGFVEHFESRRGRDRGGGYFAVADCSRLRSSRSEEKRQDQALSAGNIGNVNSSPEQRMATLAQINTMRQFCFRIRALVQRRYSS